MRTVTGLLVLVLAATAPAIAQQNRDGGLGGWTRDDSRRENPLPGLEVIDATVVKYSVRTNGWWIITLDNGQKWAQVEHRANATVGVGDPVQLRRSRIGSYVLTNQHGVETRVRRER